MGLKTLLLDKKPRLEVGQKVCGDEISKSHFEATGIEFPKEQEISGAIAGADVYPPSMSNELKVRGWAEFDGWTVNRLSFGQRLLGEAIDAGVAFQANSRVSNPILRNDAVIGVEYKEAGEKKEVYAKLDAICPQDCVLAANTSTIPITRLASLTKRPSKVIGMHFMNPAPLKPVVEMIRGAHTSDDTLETAKRLLAQMGKECIIVQDSPGFVSNRVLMLAINEAIRVVQEGVARAEDVDRIFKTCFAHKMGPLETADLIGLDTVLYSLQVLHEHFGDDRYSPCPLLEDMVKAGLHGQKAGQGFYQYAKRSPKPTGKAG